jgi:hypothetical protein
MAWQAIRATYSYDFELVALSDQRSPEKKYVSIHKTKGGELIQRVDLAEQVELSPDGRLIALAFSYERIEVRVAQTGVVVDSFGRPGQQRWCDCFDATGKYLVYWTSGGSRARRIVTGDEVRVPGRVHTVSPVLDLRSNRVLVPLRGKGSLCELSFAPFGIRYAQVPIRRAIQELALSPAGDVVFALDSGATLHCLDAGLGRVSWSRDYSDRLASHARDFADGRFRVRERIIDLAISGDGTLLALTVTDDASSHLVVVDSRQGDVLHTIDDWAAEGHLLPYRDTRVVSNLDVVDLTTGETQPLSRPICAMLARLD